MLGKTQIKNIFMSDLKSFVKSYGFKVGKAGGCDSVMCDSISHLKYITVDISSDGLMAYNLPQIRWKLIEEQLWRITNKSEYTGRFTIAIQIKEICDVFFNKTQCTVTIEQDVLRITEAFKTAFVELYVPAFEKYSDPKNVLELWDSLDTVEKKNMFFPDTNNYIKILMMSYHCQETIFEKRVQDSIDYYTGLKNTGKPYYQNNLDYCIVAIEMLKKGEIQIM